MCDRWSHPAARRSERHFHFYARAAIVLFDQTAIVNQTKINNIDRDFGIVALPKLIPDVFIRDFAICSAYRLLSRLRLRFFKTQSIKIVLGDSRQALISRDRITAAQALRDHALSSSRDRCLLPARNLDGLAIATQCEFSVLVHGFPLMSFRPKSRNLWTA